jgi:hypothetical protein
MRDPLSVAGLASLKSVTVKIMRAPKIDGEIYNFITLYGEIKYQIL